jgi:hypothetical protein
VIVSKFSKKVHFCPQTSHIIPLLSLDIFLIPDLKEKRDKLSNSGGEERKTSLTLISITKTIDFYIK